MGLPRIVEIIKEYGPEEKSMDPCDLTEAEFSGRAKHTREYRGGGDDENTDNVSNTTDSK